MHLILLSKRETTMKTSTTIRQYALDQNLSFMDRQIRAVIGSTMLAAPMMFGPEILGMWNMLMLAAIPVISSAIIGWDPIYALTGKNSYVANEEEIHQRDWSVSNVGIMDRGIRAGIGLLMLYSLMTMGTMNMDMVFSLLAIPLIMSAITAWDPVYAALGINSFGSRIDVEAAEPYATEKTIAEFYEFPTPQPSNRVYSTAA